MLECDCDFCQGEETNVCAWNQILPAITTSISTSLWNHWCRQLSTEVTKVTKASEVKQEILELQAGYNGIKTALYLMKAGCCTYSPHNHQSLCYSKHLFEEFYSVHLDSKYITLDGKMQKSFAFWGWPEWFHHFWSLWQGELRLLNGIFSAGHTSCRMCSVRVLFI